jgi:hypothetical protein
MDSLKRIVKSAMDDRSPRFILGTIALGVVVALVAGTLIGYKLDNRGSSGTGGTKAQPAAVRKKPAKRRPAKATIVPAPLLVGSVVAGRPAKIAVVGANQQRVPLIVTPGTKVETTKTSSAAGIVVGAHVLYAPTSSKSPTAAEVVVLPSSSLIGMTVTAVSPSTSMTLNGKLVIKTSGATVWTTTPSDRLHIPAGSKVAVYYVTVRGKGTAVDVAVLPANSKISPT